MYTHTFELSPHFVTRTQNHCVTFGRLDSKYKNNSKGFQQFVSYHLKIWDTLYEAIAEYYCATSSYEKILKRIQEKEKSSYYSLILPTNPLVCAFIKKYLHYDEAEKDFQKVLFRDEKIRGEFYKAFNEII